MFSDTEIANLALSHLKNGIEIADLTTEKSAEARAIRQFWTIARKKALRDFPWPFAGKFVALGLLEQAPNDEWGYSYQYPADCLYFRRILSGARVDTEDSAVPFRMAYGNTGQIILTDQYEAQAEYTIDVELTGRWPVDFTMAHSFLLAHYAAPRILGPEGGSVAQRVLQLYAFEIDKARANAFNEQRRDPDPDAEMIRARG